MPGRAPERWSKAGPLSKAVEADGDDAAAMATASMASTRQGLQGAANGIGRSEIAGPAKARWRAAHLRVARPSWR